MALMFDGKLVKVPFPQSNLTPPRYPRPSLLARQCRSPLQSAVLAFRVLGAVDTQILHEVGHRRAARRVPAEQAERHQGGQESLAGHQ